MKSLLVKNMKVRIKKTVATITAEIVSEKSSGGRKGTYGKETE